jgi:hypothetical protein
VQSKPALGRGLSFSLIFGTNKMSQLFHYQRPFHTYKI